MLTREADPSRPECDVRRERPGRLRVVADQQHVPMDCTSFEDTYRESSAPRAAAATFSTRLRPDIAHIQHLTCLSTGLVTRAGRARTPVVMTLNDYWLLCHRGQLFDLDWRRCDGRSRRLRPLHSRAASPRASLRRSVPDGPSGAARSRRRRGGPHRGRGSPIGSARQARRSERRRFALDHMREAVAPVDVFLAPSQTMADRVRGVRHRRRPSRPVRTRESTFGARPSSWTRHEDRSGSASSGPAPVEGAAPADRGRCTAAARIRHRRILGRALSLSRRRQLQGHIRASARAAVRPPARPRATRDDARRISAASTCSSLPSVWLENSPFVIKEAFAAGLPVVASDSAAWRSWSSTEVDGLLFEPGNADALAVSAARLQTETGLLERLRAGIRPPMTIEQDAAALRAPLLGADFDRKDASRRPSLSTAEPITAPAAETVTAIVLNYRTPEQTWLAVRSLQTSFAPPGSILVVDNGSSDGSAGRFATSRSCEPAESSQRQRDRAARQPWVSCGCNVGIERALQAAAEWVLLVNSDVVLAPDALLAAACRARCARPSAGILGPLVLSREEPDLIASAGISYSVGDRTDAQPAHRASLRRLRRTTSFERRRGERLRDVDPARRAGEGSASSTPPISSSSRTWISACARAPPGSRRAACRAHVPTTRVAARLGRVRPGASTLPPATTCGWHRDCSRVV